ncbi:MAG: IS66 family insertion sequence element accessory protein TnpB [Methylobacter sp.]|jgi:transposase|nr:IS66 family insertion sequence element accessory protein TnpB [Methylobacter sp.]
MMKPANELSLVYLCSQPVDFRKGMLGLSALVEANLSLNPFAETLFVFCNRQRSGIKMLYWQRNGFCLWQKRLEKEHFFWPETDQSAVIELTVQQLNWLLEGYDIKAMKPHKKLCYDSVL